MTQSIRKICAQLCYFQFAAKTYFCMLFNYKCLIVDHKYVQRQSFVDFAKLQVTYACVSLDLRVARMTT